MECEKLNKVELIESFNIRTSELIELLDKAQEKQLNEILNQCLHSSMEGMKTLTKLEEDLAKCFKRLQNDSDNYFNSLVTIIPTINNEELLGIIEENFHFHQSMSMKLREFMCRQLNNLHLSLNEIYRHEPNYDKLFLLLRIVLFKTYELADIARDFIDVTESDFEKMKKQFVQANDVLEKFRLYYESLNIWIIVAENFNSTICNFQNKDKAE